MGEHMWVFVLGAIFCLLMAAAGFVAEWIKVKKNNSPFLPQIDIRIFK